jgi:hypothetical protein
MNLCWFGPNRYKYLVLLNFSLLFLFCKGGGDQENQRANKIESYADLPDHFKDFYQRFHTDSVYQMNRIDFPLRGLPAHAHEEDNTFTWNEENWVFHKLFDEKDTEYKRIWVLKNENTINEYINSTISDFGMQRTFKKRTKEWYLSYYAAMNRLY